MDYLATHQLGLGEHGEGADRREATRFTSLIRAAKLVVPEGEFVCVIRDVSSTGIGLRMFHAIPPSPTYRLLLQNGESYGLDCVRTNGNDASFSFGQPVDVEGLIVEAQKYPKRQLRIPVDIAANVSTLTQRDSARIRNVSQQGAMVETGAMLALEQPVRLESDQWPALRAKVRWRRDDTYGLAFDNTFSLREFAIKVAALQCPDLLED